MLKVTIKFTIYCVFFLFYGCWVGQKKNTEQETLHFNDSVAEWRIDSAYTEIQSNCDTMLVYQVPRMVDSLLKDTALLQLFFGRNNLYTDADKKVEKVIRQLQADCDSNLLKETYRIARLRQKLKPVQRTKAKV